jgi:translation elongation factor EF-Ts
LLKATTPHNESPESLEVTFMPPKISEISLFPSRNTLITLESLPKKTGMSMDMRKSRMKNFLQNVMTQAQPYVKENKYFVEMVKSNNLRITTNKNNYFTAIKERR